MRTIMTTVVKKVPMLTQTVSKNNAAEKLLNL